MPGILFLFCRWIVPVLPRLFTHTAVPEMPKCASLGVALCAFLMCQKPSVPDVPTTTGSSGQKPGAHWVSSIRTGVPDVPKAMARREKKALSTNGLPCAPGVRTLGIRHITNALALACRGKQGSNRPGDRKKVPNVVPCGLTVRRTPGQPKTDETLVMGLSRKCASSRV